MSRYLDVPNDALFPFGHGLTYTTFRYANVSVSHPTVSVKELTMDAKARPVIATANVTNTGSREGTEIVQCYVNVRGASTEQPVRTLKGFARITLNPGESRLVRFPLGFEQLSFYNAKARSTLEPETEYTVYIGGSSTAEQATHFRLTQ